MAQFNIQDFINQILGGVLPQPRSQDDMMKEAQGLYDPYYEEMYGETGGDYDRSRSRLLEDFGISKEGIGTNKSRFLEDYGLSKQDIGRQKSRGVQDYGTSESRLNKTLADLSTQQGWERGSFNENLISSGLGDSGIGNQRRQMLQFQQRQAKDPYQYQLSDLGTNRARFLEDIGLSSSALDRTKNRGLYDFGKELESLGLSKNRGIEDIGIGKTRSLRDINRQKSSAIQGYVNDPNFMFYT